MCAVHTRTAHPHWWLLLNKCELNSYTLLHCSPQMLHFHGLLSEWQPLCKKYSVWSGNSMPQKRHWSMRLLRWWPIPAFIRSSVSAPVDVIAPFDVVAMGAVEATFADEEAAVDSVEIDIDELDRRWWWLMPPLLTVFAAPPDDVVDDDDDDVLLLLVWFVVGELTLLQLALAMLLLLRTARLLARAEMRRFKSSRSNDFNGETCNRLQTHLSYLWSEGQTELSKNGVAATRVHDKCHIHICIRTLSGWVPANQSNRWDELSNTRHTTTQCLC